MIKTLDSAVANFDLPIIGPACGKDQLELLRRLTETWMESRINLALFTSTDKDVMRYVGTVVDFNPDELEKYGIHRVWDSVEQGILKAYRPVWDVTSDFIRGDYAGTVIRFTFKIKP